MSERSQARGLRSSVMGRLSLPARLVVSTLPLVTVALLAAIFLVRSSGSAGDDGVAILIGVAVAVVAIGSLAAVYSLGRSVSRGIEAVTAATVRVANKDLIDLLDTLRSPNPDLSALQPPNLDTGREDEVGDLTRSFDRLHRTLVDVAGKQMETLRVGVSSIFATLARRNSSLIDRQLILLDELESREEDPKTLGSYYRIDHLAARMRRNAESLLVLAGSDSPRVWAKATDMADVVRAAVGEIDEYQRVEVMALEPAKLSGGIVTDIAHLLAEVIENAIQFSPPSEVVRVTGLFDTTGYQLSVSDRGVGVSESRIAELNRVLETPPALGLSVEPTLGIYVVAKLAHKNGIKVELVPGVPGLTARVTVPRDHLEVVATSEPGSAFAPRDGRGPRGPEIEEVADAATREYVLKRTAGRLSDAPAAVVADGDVIDLTEPEMHPSSPVAGESLPVRTPGMAFSEEDEAQSTAPAEGAIRLKSALTAYERGKRAAAEEVTKGEDDE